MIVRVYIIGCVVSAILTCCDIIRKTRHQQFVASAAILTIVRWGILSWGSVVMMAMALVLEMNDKLLEKLESKRNYG